MLTVKTLLGAGWSVSTRLANRLIDFVTLLILARALSPADFGLTALAMTVIAVVETVFEIALIQALTRLPHVDKSHLDTAFTLGLLRGLVFAVVVLVAAWPFASVYKDDRLVLLIAVLAIGPIARGLVSPGIVKFIRQLSFREIFVTQVLAKIIAAVLAFTILYLGGGYWAIAANSIATAVAATVFSYMVAPYRPAFSLSHLPEFLGFIGWFSFAQLISALNWQFDRILLGNFVSKSDFGRYTMAADLAALPTQSLIGPAMQPVMAAFAKIADDADRLRNAFLKASRFTMMLAMPACIFMALTADYLIEILLDAEWKESAAYLQWLALTVLLNAYFQPLYSLALAVNQPRAIFRLNAIDLLFRLILVPLGLYYYSVWGVIAARGVVSVIMFVASAIYARNLVGISVSTQLRNLWESAAACVAMALSVLLLRHHLDSLHLNTLVEFACVVPASAVVYAGALFAFGVRFTTLISAQR
ncbi:MAG: lipopolysaccharide biosynthesis protein [Hyphomonadaceae bacterium]|nr:lipopolysaccharide biosynthesis protein [Hyphomonadaceae bacterium]